MHPRVDSQNLPQLRQNVFRVVRQAEMLKLGIGRSLGCCAGFGCLLTQVVERIKRHRQIRRAHRLPQDTQPNPALAAEQHLECRVHLRRLQFLRKQPGRRVG